MFRLLALFYFNQKYNNRTFFGYFKYYNVPNCEWKIYKYNLQLLYLDLHYCFKKKEDTDLWIIQIIICLPLLSQVNDIDLRAASHDEAINVLRQTPQRVRLTVYRDEAQYKEEDLWDSFPVELHKKPGQGLGLSIVGRRWEIYY